VTINANIITTSKTKKLMDSRHDDINGFEMFEVFEGFVLLVQ